MRSSSVGGKSNGGSGVGQGATPSGGAGGAVATAGSAGAAGTPASCEFDEAKLTEALPATIIWEDFNFASGELCVHCANSPCGAIKVVSWGIPQAQPGGVLTYQPSIDQPSISLSLGANDGVCAKANACGSKLFELTVVVTPVMSGAEWRIDSVRGYANFQSNMCLDQATGSSGPVLVRMGDDVLSELQTSLRLLKVPCD